MYCYCICFQMSVPWSRILVPVQPYFWHGSMTQWRSSVENSYMEAVGVMGTDFHQRKNATRSVEVYMHYISPKYCGTDNNCTFSDFFLNALFDRDYIIKLFKCPRTYLQIVVTVFCRCGWEHLKCFSRKILKIWYTYIYCTSIKNCILIIW